MRTAVEADAEAWADLHVAAWRAAYAAVMDPEYLAGLEPARTLDRRRAALREPGDVTHLAAELDGRVVGMAGIGPAREGGARSELYAINVHPDAWGTGVGTALLEAAVEGLRGLGHPEAYLYVVRENARARRFYAREGWRPDGFEKSEEIGGAVVTEVRYRRAL